jgi:tetratricopeptide (TPR) repeat protein
MSTKRFRIAFSFAGEKRDFVAKVATLLATRFGEAAILYDKFHEAEFARYDLGIYLPELYHKESDLVVVVVCPDYDVKQWTGLEWTAIHDLLSKRMDNEVMLCRFDRAEVKGLYSTAGFIELNHKTPEQAASLILERLALNEGLHKDQYKTASRDGSEHLRTSIPNNLPSLQPFFGRVEELKLIAEALDPESRTWGALIDGPGGMGKTSLAVRAAYDCPPEQFQRIIFVSVKDREMDDSGERKLTGFILSGLLEILNELARELGQPDITKAPEDQRIRLLLDALRPAQALVILDNLESLSKDDRDQLFTFVKRLPQGCKAILTSRRRIGSGSELLILEKLDPDAALETLADLARRNPLLARTNEAERLTLYTQTGGKPLLLRWVAGQLGRGSCRTFTDALYFLRSCPPDNDPLEFIFGDLAKEFTDDETKVLVALTYFTLPAKVEHIAELAGLKEEPAETALRTLANRSLVVPDQEETAFALVPMVAEFLRRSRPEVVAETGSRLEKRAYALIVENGYSKHDRFPVLNAAWPTVAPALPLFVAGSNEQLQTVCDALADFLNFTGRWDEWLSLSQQMEAKAAASDDHYNAGWEAYRIGWVHYLRQQADAVLACADRAASHWETVQAGARERAFSIRLRGLGHAMMESYPAAIAAYRQALDLWRTFSAESEDVVIVLNDLSDAEKSSGDLAAAERDYREALRVARTVGYAEGVAYITGNLAGLALNREDWPGAESLAREALPLSEKLGRQQLIALDCYRLAESLARQGKPTEALPYAQRAVDIVTRLGMPSVFEAAQAILRECESSPSDVDQELEP